MGAMLVRHEPTSASTVRRELALDLDLHGVDDTVVDDAALVVSELVGNAVRHAGVDAHEHLDVSWSISEQHLTISVEDPSDEHPVLRRAAPDAPSGRGLSIIAALAVDWGVEPTPRGKRVWATLALRPAR